MSARKRADQVLVARHYYDSRAKAQEAIAAGLVMVDGMALKKPSDMIHPNGIIIAQKPYPWVSRGGVKLDHALREFNLDPCGQFCLDIGASTGGFTHVLLDREAEHVWAVDVGHDQLHHSLRNHPRLTVLEGQDIRKINRDTFPVAPTLIVMDVSFISVTLILEHVNALAAEQADLVVLIKPQFEVGKAHISKNGLVKDAAIQHAICEQIRDRVTTLGWTVSGLIPSPIKGGDGNLEFLLGATRKKASTPC